MTRLLRSELLKLVTTRGPYGLLAGAVAVAALGAFSTVMSADPQGLTGPMHEQTFYMLASINVGIFALVLGIRSFTDEFRHGTVVPTLLAIGNRTKVMTAKVVASALGAVILTVAALAGMVGLALLLSSLKGGSLTLATSDLGAMAGMLGSTALWSAIGVGIGAVVRHQVAAIVGGVIWILVVENLGAGLLRDAGRFLPGQAAHGLADAVGAGDLLAVPVAALVLGTYTLLAWLVGSLDLARRDVI